MNKNTGINERHSATDRTSLKEDALVSKAIRKTIEMGGIPGYDSFKTGQSEDDLSGLFILYL